MAQFQVGDVVRVAMPKGFSKRGVPGISVMYTTWPEARFDGAIGKISDINPRGPNAIPQFLVDFRGQDNRVAIPWQAQWFREEWLTTSDRPTGAEKPARGEREAPSGQAATSTGVSS
ncbi:MAG: hypothetical protein ACJ789_07120 [Thermomicrobiales bacterium]|jgi:hypothetical protein